MDHVGDLTRLTGMEINWQKDWAPWSDTSYLNAEDLADPDIVANVRAIAEVCERIAFVAENQEGEYFGYWRGLDQRSIADSPVVYLDNEGSFHVCSGSNLAEAIAGTFYDVEEFLEIKVWLNSIGIAMQAESEDALATPDCEQTPSEVHQGLYDRYTA